MSNPLLDYYRKPNPMRDRLSGGRERVFPTKHPMVKAEDKYPEVDLGPEMDKWFKENPNTSGMAVGGGLNGFSKDDPRVVMINPYSGLTKQGRESVLLNEKLRHFMDESDYDTGPGEPTQAQIDFFKGTEYGKPENRKYLGQTIAARIVTGDSSAGDVTPEQRASAARLKQDFDNTSSNVKMAGVNMGGKERVIPTMVEGKQLSVKEAAALARSQGLEKYPSFKTVEEANAFAEANNGSITEDGFLKQTPATAADFMKASRYQRRNLLRK